MSIIETLFRGTGHEDPHSVRLKIIRPVFESIAVNEAAEAYLTGEPLNCAQSIFDSFKFLQQEAKEHFLALHLDSKNQLLCIDLISSGSLSASIVHPREVYKSVLLSSAASLILIHNHPSGNSTPSREDRQITTRLKEAGELLGIRLLDHIIIGTNFTSLAELGEL
jgi:DNA repair protein RadC